MGTPPAPVASRLDELGVTVIPSSPHRLDELTRTANKLLALLLPQRAYDDGVLLVDNDMCLLDDISELPRSAVGASVASQARITAEQWAELERSTGLAPIPTEWVSLHEERRARVLGRAVRKVTGLYLNSGVVWVEKPARFEPVWADHIQRIDKAFREHRLHSSWLSGWGGDQAGLATAVAESGGFRALPIEYNYRPVCFRLGAGSRPKILHLGELGAKGALRFSDSLGAWWKKRIVRPLESDAREGADNLADAWTLEAVLNLRDRLLRLGEDAGIDRFELDVPAARRVG